MARITVEDCFDKTCSSWCWWPPSAPAGSPTAPKPWSTGRTTSPPWSRCARSPKAGHSRKSSRKYDRSVTNCSSSGRRRRCRRILAVTKAPSAHLGRRLSGAGAATTRPAARSRHGARIIRWVGCPGPGATRAQLLSSPGSQTYLPPDDIASGIVEAYEFGASAHRGQKRRTGDPYITHPVAVAASSPTCTWTPAPSWRRCCTT
jgi:hypothetical protein